MRSRLFVGSLSYEASEEDLQALFSTVGEVVKVSIRTDRKTGKPRGFAFVQMATPEQATRAILELNGRDIRGREIRILEAQENPSAPRRRDTGSMRRITGDEATAEGRGPTPAPETALFRRARGLTAGIVLGVVAIAVGLYVALQPPDVPVDPSTLFVAPFELQGAPNDEDPAAASYLGYALAQAIAVNLATAPGIKVLPVPQAEELDAASSAARAEAGRTRGAGRLLEGVVTRSGETVRASITLVHTTESRVLWGIQKEDTDILTLASVLGHNLAAQLNVVLPSMHPYIHDLTGSPAMSASPITAEVLAALKRGDVSGAVDSTQRLRRTFPRERAAAALRTHALVLAWDAEPTDENLKAVTDGLATLEAIDPDGPYGPIYRAYLAFRQGSTDRAVGAFGKVLGRSDLSPTARAWVLRYRAVARQQRGDVQGALSDLNESLRLDPTNAWTLGILGAALEEAGHYEQAVARARQGVALMPGFWRTHHTLANALSRLDRWKDAATAYGTACELGRSQTSCALHAVNQYRSDAAEAAAEAAVAAAELTPTIWGEYNLACYHALAGDIDAAFEHLRASVELGLADRTVETDDDLAALREDPRFAELVAEVTKRADPL